MVCVGTKTTLLFHELAFDNRAELEGDIRRAAQGFEPQFIEIAQADLPIEDAVKSYLFNSQIVSLPPYG